MFRYLYNRIVIPRGDYCYKMKKLVVPKDGSKPYLKTRNCPYWCWDEEYPDGRVGYCKLLKVSDMDEDSCGLLFDQIKECGVNEYDEDHR
jgi:hypothetical protein